MKFLTDMMFFFNQTRSYGFADGKEKSQWHCDYPDSKYAKGIVWHDPDNTDVKIIFKMGDMIRARFNEESHIVGIVTNMNKDGITIKFINGEHRPDTKTIGWETVTGVLPL